MIFGEAIASSSPSPMGREVFCDNKKAPEWGLLVSRNKRQDVSRTKGDSVTTIRGITWEAQ